MCGSQSPESGKRKIGLFTLNTLGGLGVFLPLWIFFPLWASPKTSSDPEGGREKIQAIFPRPPSQTHYSMCQDLVSRTGSGLNDVPPLKVCLVVWLSTPAFSSTMPASPAFPTATVLLYVVVCTKTVPQPPHHLMVLVAQQPRQEKWGFVSASGLKAPPWPPFAIDGNIPLLLDAGPPLGAAASSRGQRLLCGVVTGCISVVPQLVDALHKFTLFVEHFLGRWWGKKKEWACWSNLLCPLNSITS